jgi:hypothetical protein
MFDVTGGSLGGTFGELRGLNVVAFLLTRPFSSLYPDGPDTADLTHVPSYLCSCLLYYIFSKKIIIKKLMMIDDTTYPCGRNSNNSSCYLQWIQTKQDGQL